MNACLSDPGKQGDTHFFTNTLASFQTKHKTVPSKLELILETEKYFQAQDRENKLKTSQITIWS